MPHVHAEQRLQSLLEITQLLMSAVGPDEVLTVTLSTALRLCDAAGCSLALLDSTGQELAFVAMAGPAQVEGFRIAVGQGGAGWVAQTGQGVVCNDVTQDARFFQGIDQQTGYTTRSLLCAPLKQHDQILGVIEVLNTTRPEGFQDEDLALLMTFGSLVGPALTRTQAYARVRTVRAAREEVVHSRYRLVPGTSPAMQEMLRQARTVAATPTTVLLLGESGTGKEVLARAIHPWSPRADHPFVAVHCVMLTPELLASELFGHEKGAFTGATGLHKGKFELAHGGTLFLDEIGDLAPDLQAKLLRVLQDKEFQRVGGTRDLRVDVRLLAATNRDLHQAMRRGAFREDLYYRLNVVTLTLPPLRDRCEDIPALVAHFLAQYGGKVNRPGLRIAPAALDMLQAYSWPGNVRELQNAIERAAVLAPDLVLTASDFPPAIRQAYRPPATALPPGAGLGDTPPRAAAPAPQEWGAARALPAEAVQIQQALIQTGGNVALAARLLGVSRDTVRYRMQRYGLARPRLGALPPPGAARASWCLGYPDQALARCRQEAVAYAQRLGHPYSLAWSQSFVAEIHHWRGELLAAQHMAEASLSLAMTQGFQAWIVRGRLVCGMVLTRLGYIEAGIAQMQQGLEGMQATGAIRARAYFLAYLARAYMHLGQPDAGLTCLTEALALKQSHPHLRYQNILSIVTQAIIMRTDQPPFHDVRVRRAISHAIDRQGLIEAVWGRGEPTAAAGRGLVDWSLPIDQLGIGARYYQYSPQKARHLLADAGYAQGFKTQLIVSGGFGRDLVDDAQLVQHYLKDVGIEAELKIQEYGAYMATTGQGKFEGLVRGPFGIAWDPDVPLYRPYAADSSWNVGHVNDSTLTAMLKAQRRTKDLEARRHIVFDIQRYAAEQQYYVNTSVNMVTASWAPYVKNYGPNITFDFGSHAAALWLER